MKTITAVLLITTRLSTVIAQPQEIRPFDSSDLKVSKEKKPGAWIGKPAKIKPNYEFDHANDDRELVNMSRVYNEYSVNGERRNKAIFQKDMPNGYVIIYNEKGQISEAGTWFRNHWIGRYRSFYPNGNVKYDFVFNRYGKRTGVQKYYYESGALSKKCYYEDGNKMGVFSDYYENGETRSETKYRKGKIVDTKSNLTSSGSFGNGTN
jgi:antitoxin component YwqK of YwqJK toxin-antitoxin module